MTSDLWALREWLTIAEAARYLSSAIGEKVGEADILRLGLDGQLKLSVHLPSGTKGWFHPDGADPATRPTSMTRIEGLWDLLMVDAGKQQIEHDYHHQAHLPFISVDGIAGAWVERADERRQLEPFRGCAGLSSRSPSALSESGVLAVRVEVLDALAAKMPAPKAQPVADPPEKPVGQRERTTLLTIIAALAEEAKIDVSKPTKAGETIAALISSIGYEVAPNTVAGHLRTLRKTLSGETRQTPDAAKKIN
jgi:hypothetical protein